MDDPTKGEEVVLFSEAGIKIENMILNGGVNNSSFSAIKLFYLLGNMFLIF